MGGLYFDLKAMKEKGLKITDCCMIYAKPKDVDMVKNQGRTYWYCKEGKGCKE